VPRTQLAFAELKHVEIGKLSGPKKHQSTFRALASANNPANLQDANKVKVRLYMESQCPACKRFSTTYLKQLMSDKDMRNIIDFKFVPWGNALVSSTDGIDTQYYNTTSSLTQILGQYQQVLLNIEYESTHNYAEQLLHSAAAGISDSWISLQQATGIKRKTSSLVIPSGKPKPLTFNCQHGFTECAGNAWESCVQHIYPEQAQFFPVIDCIEQEGCAEGQTAPTPGTFAEEGACKGKPSDVVPGCVAKHGPHMDFAKLNACMVSQSTILLLKSALETAKLSSREWVPWLVIENEPVSKNSSQFSEMFLIGHKICSAYTAKTGKEAPAVCSTYPIEAPEDPYAAFDSDKHQA